MLHWNKIGVGLGLAGLICFMALAGRPRSGSPFTFPVPSPPGPLSHYLNENDWSRLFPHRYAVNAKGRDFYSFHAFAAAVEKYPGFLSEKDVASQKRELAAFLANIAQETSGGWEQAPGGYFTWGLYFVAENGGKGILNAYADTSKHIYPPVTGKLYFGRGPAQLSWNYNYGQFSEAWFGNKDTLLKDPDRLIRDPVLSFASALWFWMTPQSPKPSCHQIMSGEWEPTPDDLKKGRLPGFGATVNVLNGGVECGTGKDLQKTSYRYQYYRYFCTYLHVAPGDNVSCRTQLPFGQ